jgi:hypothetical protein
MVDPAAKLAVEFREECAHDEPPLVDDGGERRVHIPPYRCARSPTMCASPQAGVPVLLSAVPASVRRDIECDSSPARGGSFQLGRQYIHSSSLVARLIERRDDNPVAVDYDLDSEDDEMLDRVNGVGEVLPADALEAAMRSLEVESFGVMMQHVEVTRSTCPPLARSCACICAVSQQQHGCIWHDAGVVSVG